MADFFHNLLRLFWYIPYRILKFLKFGRTLYISNGWDTLYPLAPYSEGGLLKKDFLILYKKDEVTSEEYSEKQFGKWDDLKAHYEFWERAFSYQDYLKKWWI
jgi:hypothetical protein